MSKKDGVAILDSPQELEDKLKDWHSGNKEAAKPADLKAERRTTSRKIAKFRHDVLLTLADDIVTVKGVLTDVSFAGNGGLGIICSGLVRVEGQDEVFGEIEFSSRRLKGKITVRIVYCVEVPLSGHVMKPDGTKNLWKIGLQIQAPKNQEEEKFLAKLFHYL
jgi:hypothetical protein